MAGGKLAEYVACVKCTQKTKRTFEGIEDDSYECTVCGNKFSIHWEEVPTKPTWPISEKERQEMLEMIEKVKEAQGKA